MNLIVTGGSGFIGSNFIDYWSTKHPEDNITNIDKMTYASNKWFNRNVEGSGHYRFRNVDISVKGSLDGLMDGADCVVNFAAESHVDRSIADPINFVNSNILGIFNLLEYTRKYDIRLHQVSTDEVYGSLRLEDEGKFTEESCYNPKNPYSATKASADLLIRSYVNTYGLNATISNCGNNFGPHQHPEKLIPKTILAAISGNRIPIYGDGKQVRDWVYVEDHVSAIDAIIARGKPGKTYLIGADNEISNMRMVKKILGLLNADPGLIEHVKDRPGHDVRYSLSAAKIKSDLGWFPKYSLDDSIRRTIMHYTDNYEIYRNIALKQ